MFVILLLLLFFLKIYRKKQLLFSLLVVMVSLRDLFLLILLETSRILKNGIFPFLSFLSFPLIFLMIIIIAFLMSVAVWMFILY